MIRVLLAAALGALIVGAVAGWFGRARWDAAAVERLEVQRDRLIGEVADWRRAGERWTIQVEEWRQTGEEQSRRLAEAEARAAQVRIQWRDRVREVQAAAPPPETPCHEAVDWAIDRYLALVGEWQ